jgi:hypothetical protein
VRRTLTATCLTAESGTRISVLWLERTKCSASSVSVCLPHGVVKGRSGTVTLAELKSSTSGLAAGSAGAAGAGAAVVGAAGGPRHHAEG